MFLLVPWVAKKGLKACNFIKKRLQRRCFPVNIARFLRTPFLKNICERLLLLCRFHKRIFQGKIYVNFEKTQFLWSNSSFLTTWETRSLSRLYIFFFEYYIFRGKHLCQSLFLNEFACWNSASFLKKTPAEVFTCEIFTFLRTRISSNVIKKETLAKVFSYEF